MSKKNHFENFSNKDIATPNILVFVKNMKEFMQEKSHMNARTVLYLPLQLVVENEIKEALKLLNEIGADLVYFL